MINVARVFKVLQSCGGGMACREVLRHKIIRQAQCLHVAKLSLWFAQVHSVQNNISKSAMHRSVCIIATLLGVTLTNSNKFIHIVTLRHSSDWQIVELRHDVYVHCVTWRYILDKTLIQWLEKFASSKILTLAGKWNLWTFLGHNFHNSLPPDSEHKVCNFLENKLFFLKTNKSKL